MSGDGTVVNMLLSEAIRLSNGDTQTGYRVSFEQKQGSFTRVGFFPDPALEAAFSTVEQAKAFAKLFADGAPDEYQNIVVVDSPGLSPIEPYETREILRSTVARPQAETAQESAEVTPAPAVRSPAQVVAIPKATTPKARSV